MPRLDACIETVMRYPRELIALTIMVAALIIGYVNSAYASDQQKSTTTLTPPLNLRLPDSAPPFTYESTVPRQEAESDEPRPSHSAISSRSESDGLLNTAKRACTQTCKKESVICNRTKSAGAEFQCRFSAKLNPDTSYDKNKSGTNSSSKIEQETIDQQKCLDSKKYIPTGCEEKLSMCYEKCQTFR
jgi:hypothetical protein